MTRAPSVSSRPGRPATSREQVTGTERSAAGSRRVRKTVAALPRRFSWATCPSTQTSPSRPIHSATLRATVRTGQGDSGEEGAVTWSRVPGGSSVDAGGAGERRPRAGRLRRRGRGSRRRARRRRSGGGGRRGHPVPVAAEGQRHLVHRGGDGDDGARDGGGD